jgi:penicillin amidase
VTANNKLINSDYKYYLGNQWNTGFRANRITNIIKKKIASGEKFTIDDMRNIQLGKI